MGKSRALAPLFALAMCVAAEPAATAEEFRIAEVRALGTADLAPLQPHVIAFADHHDDPLADPSTGLIRFEDWARGTPVQKQFLGLYPNFVEPTVDLTEEGVSTPHQAKLHIYVTEARLVLTKAA